MKRSEALEIIKNHLISHVSNVNFFKLDLFADDLLTELENNGILPPIDPNMESWVDMNEIKYCRWENES